METTYADEENGGAFQENVIPELTKIAEENEDFSGNSSKIKRSICGYRSHLDDGSDVCAYIRDFRLIFRFVANDMDTQDHFFQESLRLETY